MQHQTYPKTFTRRNCSKRISNNWEQVTALPMQMEQPFLKTDAVLRRLLKNWWKPTTCSTCRRLTWTLQRIWLLLTTLSSKLKTIATERLTRFTTLTTSSSQTCRPSNSQVVQTFRLLLDRILVQSVIRITWAPQAKSNSKELILIELCTEMPPSVRALQEALQAESRASKEDQRRQHQRLRLLSCNQTGLTWTFSKTKAASTWAKQQVS